MPNSGEKDIYAPLVNSRIFLQPSSSLNTHSNITVQRNTIEIFVGDTLVKILEAIFLEVYSFQHSFQFKQCVISIYVLYTV